MIAWAIFLGSLTATWAIIVCVVSRIGAWTGESNGPVRLVFWVLSFAASGICLLLILQVPDWRLTWIRWQQHDFCALPGHGALYWLFVANAPFAFSAPVLAYVALRLAWTLWSKFVSLILFSVTLIVLALTIHGLHWSMFWPMR